MAAKSLAKAASVDRPAERAAATLLRNDLDRHIKSSSALRGEKAHMTALLADLVTRYERLAASKGS